MPLDLSSIRSFQDAAVTVMGLGRYKKGSGIGAAKWLMRHGAQIIITDLKDENELRESIDEIMYWYTHYRSVYKDHDIYQPVFVLGKHDADNFTNVDLVLQNPGVPRESEFVQLAKKNGIRVESDISLFFRYCPFPVFSITGTRGKSTTTALLGEILKHKHPKTVVAGNITRSPLEDLDWLLEESEPVPIVLELSSWLLESLEGLKLGPQIALLTNAYKDHLDRYPSFEAYIAAKELIFQEQNEDQIAILNADQEIMHEIASRIPSKHLYWFSNTSLPEGVSGVYRKQDSLIRRIEGQETVFAHVDDLKLGGDHNVMNILSASLAAHLAGVSDEDIHQTMKTFAGLPGRQEILGELEGVLFINDTTATSPEGVMAALTRFGRGGNIVLLCGGSSKGLSFNDLGKMIGEQCKFVVVFDGTAADDMEEAIGEGALYERVNSMEQAIELAYKNAKLGDVVLLSPGTSSFGIFKNEFDRGDQFKTGFQKLGGEIVVME
ncbi:TPA: UDP-N-acetylmuramoyl-L-alanine--D-glutamate ligase [Candidatus Uhrbacteria bacterium]|nr:UDP-N-acetylmuramoyl-L-alanine--D-glutamate ligase [Candidatus Uhrbacteria bacterium]